MGITNPAQEYFKDGAWGWNGTAWVKLGVLWGYSDALYGRTVDYNATATTELDSATVPAGEVWVVTSIVGFNNDNIITSSRAFVYNGASYINIGQKLAFAAAGEYIELQGFYVIPAGGYVRVRFTGCTVNDDVYLDVHGYKMKVA